jgi:hypothetical protein
MLDFSLQINKIMKKSSFLIITLIFTLNIFGQNDQFPKGKTKGVYFCKPCNTQSDKPGKCFKCGKEMEVVSEKGTKEIIGLTQTKEEYHKALTTYHGKIKEHANAISTGSSKTKEEHAKHAEEAARNLEEAKKVFENLKNFITERDVTITKPHYEVIEKLHSVATYHITALNEELKKTNPDQTRINENAKKIYGIIEKAEKEHKFLEEKTKK